MSAPPPPRAPAALRRALYILVVLAAAAGSPTAWGEQSKPSGPDAERRALNLATFDRAWSLVDQTHFDPGHGGVDWDAVRDELRERAGAAASDRELRRVLDEMLGRLGLSHFAILPEATTGGAAPAAEPSASRDSQELFASCAPAAQAEIVAAIDREGGGAGGDAGLELRVLDLGRRNAPAGGTRVVVTRVDPDGPAATARIEAGWELLAVDGRPLAEPLVCLEDAGDPAFLRRLTRAWLRGLIAGPIDTEMRLRFDTGRSRPSEITLRRAAPRGETVRFGNLPPVTLRFEVDERTTPRRARAAVVRFSEWLLPVAAAFDRAMPALRAADGVVIDLRGNRGGVAAIAQGVAGHFVPEKLSLGSMTSRRDELEMVVQPRRVTREGEAVDPYSGPLAILIDEESASTSEIFAAGLRDHGRARLFGSPSAGAALPSILDRLPNGDVLMHASMDYVRPSGERVEGRPVVPDVETPLRREDLRAGRDAALDAALAWIDDELARRRTAGAADTREEESHAF